MTAHRQQAFLGYLFLAVGLVLLVLSVLPLVMGMLATPRGHADPLYLLAFLGIAIAVFGAWLIPSSNAGPVVQQFVTVVGPWIPRIPGLGRASDPKPTAPPSTPDVDP